jgi:hypothetical protein
MTEQPEQNAHDPEDTARSAQDDRPGTVAALMRRRLEESPLGEPVKLLLQEALGDGETRERSSVGRIYLDSVAVTGFRGIGPRAWLDLSPRPGVNLVVGRNGSGKSSIAEGIETAFTGVNTRWHGLHASRSGNWRNLHHQGGKPEIEVKLAIEGDNGRSTLTRTWDGEDFDASRGDFKRPGHGRVAVDEADFKQAMEAYRPFLSYVDLDRMISGKPAHMYDAIASILGLGDLSTADGRLRAEEKALDDAAKVAKNEIPQLIAALYELEDDERAVEALVAIDTPDSPDFAALGALVAGLPGDVDEGRIAELRLAVGVQGPDVQQVDTAVSRLTKAVADEEAVRGTSSEDAHRRAELLAQAVSHSHRHPDEAACPVCGTDEALDADARAIIATPDLPEAARTHVLPSLCRIALENAFLEAAWIRHHRRGGPERELHDAVDDADKFRKVAALALFGDTAKVDEVDAEIRARYGASAVQLVRQCQSGAHPTGSRITDARRFVDDVEALTKLARKPEVGA